MFGALAAAGRATREALKRGPALADARSPAFGLATRLDVAVDPEDAESGLGESAFAVADEQAIAAPTPKKTARPPTRPTNFPAPIVVTPPVASAS